MAFFGSADSDHLVKQLRGQLAQKDFEIQTLINEQAKKDELFSETKRAKDDAVYKAQTEQERALKADRLLQKSSAELQNAKIRLANLESTLNDANVRHKKDEKEIDRLQYELDTRNDSAAANNRVQSTVSGLQDEIKSLKNQLQRTESEKESLENQARLSGSGGIFGAGGFGGGHGGNGKEKATIFALENEMQALRRENLRLMEQDRSNASTSTPARPRTQTSFHPSPTPRSKRALSFSGGAAHPKIQALEAEIEHLRTQAMPGLDMKEVEKLRTDVESAKRHALKMENEKMAAERSIQREMDDIKSRLSDANDELQYLRALDGQSVQQELDNAKKAAKSERLALEQELQSRSDDLEKRKMDVRRLESRLSEVQDEVERLRSTVPSTSVQQDDEEVRQLRDAIESLERELDTRTTEYEDAKKRISSLEDKLKSSSKPTSDHAAPTNAQAAKQQRAHQREVEDLQQAKEALRRHLAESEELVAERDAEIFELKRHIPLPSAEVDVSLDASLTSDVVDLRQQLVVKEEELDAARKAKAIAEDRLQKVESQLEEAKAEASSKATSLDNVRGELEARLAETAEKRDALAGELAAQERKCEDWEKQFAQSETERKTLSDELIALKEAQREAAVSMSQTADDQEEISSLKERISEMEARVSSMDTIKQELADSHRSLDTLRDERSTLDRELEDAQRVLAEVRAESLERSEAVHRVEAEQQALITGHQRESESKSAAQKSRITEMQNQLDVMRDQLEESDAELGELQEKLAEATAGTLTKEDEGALAKATAERDHLQAELVQAAERATKLDAQVHDLTNRIESLNDDLEESQRLVQFADVEHNILAQAVSAAKTTEQISNAQLDRLRKELEEAEALLNDDKETTSAEREESQATMTRLRDDFAALQLEHEDLLDSKTHLETALETATSEAQRRESDLRAAREQVNSITANSTDGAVIELRRHIQELESRVSRRNQLIAVEQAKTKKVEMNLEMATQDVEELEAEIARLRDDVSAKDTLCAEKDTELCEARDESATRILLLEKELDLARQGEEALRAEARQRSDDLAKVVEQLARSDNDKQTESIRADELRQDLERVHLAKLADTLQNAEQQYQKLALDLEAAQSSHVAAYDNSNAMTVQMIMLSREIDGLERSQLEALQSVEAESRETASIKLELERLSKETKADTDRLRAQEGVLQEKLDTLTRDLEEGRSNALQEKELLQQRVDELEDQVRTASSSLEQQEAREASALEEFTAREAESIKQRDSLQQQVDKLEGQVRTSLSSLEIKEGATASAQEQLAALKAELASLREISSTQKIQSERDIAAQAAEVTSVRADFERVSRSLELATSDLEKLEFLHQVAEETLIERTQCLDQSNKTLEAVTAERNDAVNSVEALREEVAQLSARSTETQSRLQSAEDDLASLREELARASEQAQRLESGRAEAKALIQQLEKQVDTQQVANEQLNRSLAEHSRDRFQIAAERDELIKSHEAVNRQLVEGQESLQNLTKDLEAVHAVTRHLESQVEVKSQEASMLGARYQKAHDLAVRLEKDTIRLESNLQNASKKLAAEQAIVEQLTEEKALLTKPSQNESDETAHLEQIERLQTEMEEHMAEVRNANKAKALLQRKVEKLERKVKSLSEKPATADVPVSVLAPHPVVHNQDPVRLSPGALAGQKRSRDDDVAAKKTSAGPEAVIAPSPFEPTRTPIKRTDPGVNRLAFTPTRHNLNPNMGTIPRSPYGRLAAGDENAFPVMAMMRGKFSSGINQQGPGQPNL